MAASKYLEDKYRKYFRFFDVNKDGYISREDFEELGRNMLKTYAAGDTHGLETQKLIKEKWWPTFEPLTTNGKVDEDGYVKAIKSSYENNLAQFRHEIMTSAKLFSDIMDRNGDNLIDEEEFQLFYGLFNIKNKKTVSSIFKQIDIDEDGYLQVEEMVVAVVNYWSCNDPRVGYAFMYDGLV